MRRRPSEFRDAFFDSHMHFGIMLSSIFDDKTPYCQNLMGIMDILDDSFVNTAIVFPFPDDFIGNDVLESQEDNAQIRRIFEAVPYRLQNERLLLEVEQTSRGNILPFMMFSLRYHIDRQIDFLSECMGRHEVYGLKYYADADGIPLSAFTERGKPFIDWMVAHDMPLIVHTSAGTVLAGEGLSFPDDIVELALQYPELRICIAHMAHFSKSVFEQMASAKIPNLFLDTSPFLHLCNIRDVVRHPNCLELPYDSPADVLSYAVEMFPGQIIWGSDYPFNFTCNLNNPCHDKNYAAYSYAANMSVLAALPPYIRLRITHDNTMRFLFGEEENITLQLDEIYPADEEKNYVPSRLYHIITKEEQRIVGKCTLRLGHNVNTYWGGNIGYFVEEEYRGNHFAYQACCQLFEIAAKEGMDTVYITCNPDNIASRRTCEKLPGIFVGEFDIPEDNDMRLKGETRKCIFKYRINMED